MKTQQFTNRILCIWLPDWPMQRLFSEKPHLRRTEVILYERYRGTSFKIISYFGNSSIRPGMTLCEAQAIAKAHAVLHDPATDRNHLLDLASWCEQFSPIVGLEGSDCLCLDITGLASLFGNEVQLFRKVEQSFIKRGFVARIAIADTLGAAWGVAHSLGNKIVRAGSNQTLLKLPVAALRITREQIETLYELGIKRVEQLVEIAKGDLLARFGPLFIERIDQAFGNILEPLIAYRPLPDIWAELQFEYGVTNRQSLEIILKNLIEQICRVLIERQLGALQLECTLQTEDKHSLKILVGLYRATDQVQHLLDLTMTQFEQLSFHGPIHFVRLSVLSAASIQFFQRELFENSNFENQRTVALLIDLLSSRLGHNCVSHAVTQTDALPEMAFRYEPLTGNIKRKQKQKQPKRLPRPRLLMRKPIPIRVILDSHYRRMLRFEWLKPHTVIRVWGPERIQTAWWQGRYIQRDYYRVETVTGQRFWLFQCLRTATWFLHGVFD